MGNFDELKISERLKVVSDMVSYERVADIGTDHAYVLIYLYKLGKLKKAVACDINSLPLEKAKKNIKAFLADEVIETRRGNGLSPILLGEVETAVIAGMGGMLTIQILRDNISVVNSLKEIILAPQLDLDRVRKYIHEIGFKIKDEKMILEDGKFYNILRVEAGTEIYNENEYRFGKILIDEKNIVLKSYIERELNRIDIVKNELQRKDTENAKQRLIELLEEKNTLEEVIICL